MRRGLVITITAAALLLVAGVPAASASTTWGIQPTPLPAGAKGGALNGDSCTSASSCTAVGWYANRTRHGYSDFPLAEYWDGSSWAVQPMPSPSGSTGASLSGVSCTSPSSCTAVGSYTTGSGAAAAILPVAEQWNGSSWAVQPVPSPSGGYDSRLYGISCASASSCTAVGSYFSSATNIQTALAEYWDGSTWAVQATPPRGRDGSELLAVSCAAPGRCTAVGNYFPNFGDGAVLLAEHLSAGTWRVQPIQAPSGTTDAVLDGISCTAPASCTAVGDYATGSGNARVYLPLAESWDGSSWAIEPVPSHPGSPSAGIEDVSCISRSNCTATGDYSTQNLGIVAVAFHYYHGTWRLQATASPARRKVLNGISCTSGSSCTAVGWYNSSLNQLLAEQR